MFSKSEMSSWWCYEKSGEESDILNLDPLLIFYPYYKLILDILLIMDMIYYEF